MDSKLKTFCIIIPVYNNQSTIASVIEQVLGYCQDIIVVNDGSTDNTVSILETERLSHPGRVSIVSYTKNRGKGYAITKGFQAALQKGYRYAVTMDADGQHYAHNLPHFEQAIINNPDSLIVGARNLNAPGMPKKNTFANRFSNFWFSVQTLQRLPDTQTGYRLYPLERLGRIHLCGSRYEAELELLVRAAWRGIRLLPITIDVYYPQERVSHFRPVLDFTRISILNTILCIFAIIYGYPSILIHRICRKSPNK
ncbi:MAG: glycosyltransferase family 2 protein [Bacteroidaceae bacterium]|nr:glycosyltransferase family 2 protein [Bacteroidaceae bacterium]